MFEFLNNKIQNHLKRLCEAGSGQEDVSDDERITYGDETLSERINISMYLFFE